jgi:hypothetical protein
VRDALRARRVHRDLRVEISAHLAEATEEFINLGQSPEEARFAALRSFGGVSQAEEASREARSFQRLDYCAGKPAVR